MAAISHNRMHNHGLGATGPSHPTGVVRHLVAMQGQDYQSALWGVGARAQGVTEAAVEQALREGRLVRTWPLRGTIHLVAAEDVRWLLTHVSPHALARSATRHRQLGLTEADFTRAASRFRSALRGGNRLTRREMMAVLQDGGLTTDGQRGYHILWRLAQEGVLCFGPRAGKQDTFVLLDEWVPTGGIPRYDAALTDLARRYFSSHGPATRQDFMWWSGLPASDARAALEWASPHLMQHAVNGTVYWSAPLAAAEPPAPPRALLLPAFDEYLLGYRTRDDVLDPAYAHRIAPGGNGVFKPVIVIDGRVVGTWKRVRRKRDVTVALDLFFPLAPDEMRAIAAAADAYGVFLGLPVNLHPTEEQSCHQ